MKIAILTIHYANSYGGCLQALATQLILSRYGEAVIVDYKTPALESTMRLLRFSRSPRVLFHIIKDIARLFPRRRLLKKFRTFMEVNYHLSRSCRHQADLNKISNEYDVFVCGSDQIWNPSVTGKLDSPYLLNFVDGKPRIAISTSAGGYKFSESEMEVIKNAACGFKSLSFREAELVQQMALATKRSDISHTLDPTLLLTKEEWRAVLNLQASKSKSLAADGYIFVYTLKKDNVLYAAVRRVANLLKLKVIAVDQDPFLFYKTNLHIKDADPKEFLELISNSSFVVTNSFHGTAFAVNFGIPFLAVNPESGANRIKGFLNELGLDDRYIESIEKVDGVINSKVNYELVHEKLNVLRGKTIDYLNNALRGI